MLEITRSVIVPSTRHVCVAWALTRLVLLGSRSIAEDAVDEKVLVEVPVAESGVLSPA